jgi:uncharacterized glyoxalase superfamily protein PhnB
MAARKKKAAKKAVKKAVKKTARKKTAKKTHLSRRKPETLRLRAVQPGFTVNDVQASFDWYTGVLGFVLGEPWKADGKLVGGEIKAGTATLYIGQDDFKKGRDRVKGVGVRLYCETTQDIDELARNIKAKGGVLDHDPVTQPWGSRDFGITDPDGYRITIAQR